MKVDSKEIVIFNFDKYDTEDWPPDDAIGCVSWFQEKLDSIPKEHQGQAEIRIDTGGYIDAVVPCIRISYVRPKSAYELTEEEEEKVREEVRREAQERRDYERLKAKFN